MGWGALRVGEGEEPVARLDVLLVFLWNVVRRRSGSRGRGRRMVHCAYDVDHTPRERIWVVRGRFSPELLLGGV